MDERLKNNPFLVYIVTISFMLVVSFASFILAIISEPILYIVISAQAVWGFSWSWKTILKNIKPLYQRLIIFFLNPALLVYAVIFYDLYNLFVYGYLKLAGSIF